MPNSTGGTILPENFQITVELHSLPCLCPIHWKEIHVGFRPRRYAIAHSTSKWQVSGSSAAAPGDGMPRSQRHVWSGSVLNSSFASVEAAVPALQLDSSMLEQQRPSRQNRLSLGTRRATCDIETCKRKKKNRFNYLVVLVLGSFFSLS